MVHFNFKSFKKPEHTLVVKEGEKYLWPLFHNHHYMTSNQSIIDSLPRSSKFFTFYWIRENKEILIGCLGVLNQISKKPARRVTRMVILPEYQGLGFAPIMLNNISELYLKENITMYISTFHPRLGNYFENSNSWVASNNNMTTFRTATVEEGPLKDTLRDGVAMYRYHYIGGTGYKLNFNPLTITKYEAELKKMDNNNKEYKNLKRKLQSLKKIAETDYKETTPEELKTSYPEHIKSKKEHKQLFKKNKRKTLTTAERKAKKLELKIKKEQTDAFDDF